MKRILLMSAMTLSLALLSTQAQAQDAPLNSNITSGKEVTMTTQIIKSGTIPSAKGPDDYFTGTARIDNMFTAPEPSQVSTALVTFEPKARTAWHTHPYGQTLLVVSGNGWVQTEGEERKDIGAGDIVYFPPNVKHWHGATDTTALMHYAIQESKEGSPVTWMEHVEDKDYNE